MFTWSIHGRVLKSPHDHIVCFISVWQRSRFALLCLSFVYRRPSHHPLSLPCVIITPHPTVFTLPSFTFSSTSPSKHFFSSSSPVSPPLPPTIPVECDSSGLEPAEQEGVSEVRRLSGGKFLQVRPRSGPHVLHPLLRHLLHDGDAQEVQVQPLLPHQGDRSVKTKFQNAFAE